MTAQPHPDIFTGTYADEQQARILLRPNVREHFWGYEVRPNEQIIGIAFLFRSICGLLSVSSLASVIGVWLVPAVSFFGDVMIAKTMATLLFLSLAFVSGRMAARGSQVRVQIDTSVGEFREVVDGPVGKDIVLARYGFDAVENIDVAFARPNNELGQVQVTFKGEGKAKVRIAVGDGMAASLGPLRSRLASDCGLEVIGSSRDAVWNGPMAN